MILIVSDETDLSTVHVIEWLLHWNIPFFRINMQDHISLDQVILHDKSTNDIVLVKNNREKLSLKSVKAYWYRRGSIDLRVPDFFLPSDTELERQIQQFLIDETKTIKAFIHFLINRLPHISVFERGDVNKLQMLHLATQFDLKIPKTIIGTTMKQVQNTLGQLPMVTKNISESFRPIIGPFKYMTYTEEVLEKEPNASFFPSQFQTKIEKEADIRSFYLMGAFYSMAICSQQNEQTSTDFRKYDNKKPNRSFPFQLPREIESKLDKLMQAAHLESASIDLVFTKTGEFVFLEANPVGQFHMTSVPCNYNIEKKMALQLKQLAYG